ncbi:MAG: UbiA family prenyltransferase [Pseudomonadota bacterium]
MEQATDADTGETREIAEAGAAAPPLIVDLDGTLLRTDMLHEALTVHLGAKPLDLLAMPGRLKAGKAGFKRWLAGEVTPEIETLPLNQAVIAKIEEARDAGRRVELVTASDQSYADKIAAHLVLFDAAHGSDGSRNLGGEAKAAFLVERFGKGGYDYIGDSKADLPVWASARTALVVGKAAKLPVQAEGAVETLPGAGSTKAVIKAMRPHQWLKNALIFVPALAAVQFDLGTLAMAFLAFACFSLIASSVYIINDILDLGSDRRHPRKCKRPFAAGDVAIKDGIVLAGGLFVTAFLAAILFAPMAFVVVLAIYYALTFGYSLILKHKSVLDICTLAGLYSIRVVAGGAACAIYLSPWLLAFSMFVFLSLAAVKRQAEMVDLLNTDPKRKTGRPYEVDDLPVIRSIAMSAGYAAVLVLALYIQSQTAIAQYEVPEAFWMACPILLYWLTRMVMVTHRGGMSDDPIVFALRDKTSWAVIGLCFLAAVVAKVGF